MNHNRAGMGGVMKNGALELRIRNSLPPFPFGYSFFIRVNA